MAPTDADALPALGCTVCQAGMPTARHNSPVGTMPSRPSSPRRYPRRPSPRPARPGAARTRRGSRRAPSGAEVGLDALWLRISQQIVEVAYKLYGEARKADSVRILSLSLKPADNLATFRVKQEQQWGDAYAEGGRVWTHENGEAQHPDWISRRFAPRRAVRPAAGPPPRPPPPLRHPVPARWARHQGGPGEAGTLLPPEVTRAEAESVMGRRSRRRAVPDAYAIDVWQSEVAVRFAHGATQSGDTCEVGAGPTGHRSTRHDHPRRPRSGRRRQHVREVGAGSARRARAGTRPRREHQRPVPGGAADGLLAHALHGRPLRVSQRGRLGTAYGLAARHDPIVPPGIEGGVRRRCEGQPCPPSEGPSPL